MKRVIPTIQGLSLNVEESGLSFFENALLKARAGAKKTGRPCIGDDSGIMVNALHGNPGIYSKRWRQAKQSQESIAHVLADLKDFPKDERGAQMVCVLALVRRDPDYLPEFFVGIQHGFLLSTPIGENGFGYDPFFYDVADYQTNGQITLEEKMIRSHRGQAVEKLRQYLKTNPL